jgi:hypothetical protein
MPMSRSRHLLAWALCCGLAGVVFLVYAFGSLAAGHGDFLLPLDDVYIHFQYARQLASGQPFIYNPGQPPTSGATSLLYPFILALGYLLGFHDLRLGLWAIGVGALSLAGSAWLVYRLVKITLAPHWLALLLAAAFALAGPVSWHFMSGMETGLMILFTLATLYTVMQRHAWGFVVSASLLALTRPEGGIMALVAAGAFYYAARQRVLLIPLLMLFVQPAINWLVTGSAVASGSSAKSILGTVPFYWDEVVRRILENVVRIWAELLTGYSPHGGWYVPPLLSLMALAGLMWLIFDRRQRWVWLILVLWLALVTGAIATLDTAFWHFKRYQMPLLALIFPLAGWGLAWLLRIQRQSRNPSPQTPLPQGERGFRINLITVSGAIYGFLLVGFVFGTAATFLWAFALNVNYIYLQPLQMARWLQTHTVEDALIAVHDVGLMRYTGGRTTLDMVGLTTPGAAAYWRNGPGSVAEFLIMHRPDYIASYGHGHGYGLGLLADTGLYGEPLAGFHVQLDPHYNVALAGDFQGIYAPDWRLLISANPFLRNMPHVPDAQVVNVANLVSEAAAGYQWSVTRAYDGFATIPYDLLSGNCLNRRYTEVDSVRAVTWESFEIQTTPGVNLLLLTMFHPAQRGTYNVYVNDVHVDRNWIPETPGCWAIARTGIPGDTITGDKVTVHIEAQTDAGWYLPAHHAVIAQDPPPFDADDALAHFQDRAMGLMEVDLVYSYGDSGLLLGMRWYAQPQVAGDYRFFAHLYADADSPPVAQADRYVFHSPPGNWPPGTFRTTLMVNLADVSPGIYQVAIGFYNPYTLERLMPESDILEINPDGRLFIGEIEVQ